LIIKVATKKTSIKILILYNLYIKKKIQERLTKKGFLRKFSEIQYFLSRSDGKTVVFFLSPKSPDRNHSGWKELFKNNSERIFNLVFKFYILELNLPVDILDSLNGFEELLVVDSRQHTKNKKALVVWGQNLLVKYNHHHVLTLTLSRKRRLFCANNSKILDADTLGELVIYNNKKYFFDRDLDGRYKNAINFMMFDKDHSNYEKFKKTQVYYYHSFMNKLENFLRECDIPYENLDFQASHYLQDSFVTTIATNSLYQDSLKVEIINNTGVDINWVDQAILQKLLKLQNNIDLTLYNHGQTISAYEQLPKEGDETLWKITEKTLWKSISLNSQTNYLVFNRNLEEESSSMAYRNDNGFWCASGEIDGQEEIDFYSYLKKTYCFLDSGNFVSMQGNNVESFQLLGSKQSTSNSRAILEYDDRTDKNSLRQDTKEFANGEFTDIIASIYNYLSQQDNSQDLEGFLKKYKIKFSPEFQKILTEITIKDWIRKSCVNPEIGLQIPAQSFAEKRFSVIYVRHPKNQNAKAVSVEFLYKDGYLYIENIIRDIKQIERNFKFLRRRKHSSEELRDNQQYLVDESKDFYLSFYTDDLYTPTLIGRKGIIEEMENGTLAVNRQNRGEKSSKLFPLVFYYNEKLKPINLIRSLICLDLRKQDFIQYYVPPAQPTKDTIKKGFRVYHLVGKKYRNEQWETVPTAELLADPLTSLYLSTLTKDIVKIGENSPSSLLQKIAKVLIEN
jgi:hypothetical protein